MAIKKLIIFDCDGTLIDSAWLHLEALHALFKEHHLTLPDTHLIRPLIGYSSRNLISAILSMNNNQADIDLTLIETLNQAYYRFYNQQIDKQGHKTTPLYPFAKEIIKALYQSGNYTLAIATGLSRNGLHQMLRNHHLKDYFSALYSADDGPSKPNPQIITKLLKATNSSFERAVMIGDTIFDMELAKNANIQAIGVNWGYHSDEQLKSNGASIILNSFQDLPNVLESLWE